MQPVPQEEVVGLVDAAGLRVVHRHEPPVGASHLDRLENRPDRRERPMLRVGKERLGTFLGERARLALVRDDAHRRSLGQVGSPASSISKSTLEPVDVSSSISYDSPSIQGYSRAMSASPGVPARKLTYESLTIACAIDTTLSAWLSRVRTMRPGSSFACLTFTSTPPDPPGIPCMATNPAPSKATTINAIASFTRRPRTFPSSRATRTPSCVRGTCTARCTGTAARERPAGLAPERRCPCTRSVPTTFRSENAGRSSRGCGTS